MNELKQYIVPITEIIKGKQPWVDASGCGVYFLINGNEVIYVGQSLDVFFRCATHKRTKHFDYVYVINTQAADNYTAERIRLAVEAFYIALLEPPLNYKLEDLSDEAMTMLDGTLCEKITDYPRWYRPIEITPLK